MYSSFFDKKRLSDKLEKMDTFLFRYPTKCTRLERLADLFNRLKPMQYLLCEDEYLPHCNRIANFTALRYETGLVVFNSDIVIRVSCDGMFRFETVVVTPVVDETFSPLFISKEASEQNCRDILYDMIGLDDYQRLRRTNLCDFFTFDTYQYCEWMLQFFHNRMVRPINRLPVYSILSEYFETACAGKEQFEKAGIPVEHAVLLLLLMFCPPGRDKIKSAAFNGPYTGAIQRVIDCYPDFKEIILQCEVNRALRSNDQHNCQ